MTPEAFSPTQTRRSEQAIKGSGLARSLVISMRPQQWLKNLFVLAPLLFGRQLGGEPAVRHALMAAAAFCLLSSSLYIFNDLKDVSLDRAHPLKRFRPIAAGLLPPPLAWLQCAVLLGLGLWLAGLLGILFFLLSLIYVALMLGYSLLFKRIMILDGMVIAAGFVLRVVGGAVAIHVESSHWIIICAFLLALYLALGKRRQELLLLPDSGPDHREVLAHYTAEYLEQVNNILIGAAVVCYSLYTVAPETVARFGTDRLVFGSVFVLYGLLRYMALVRDPANGGDPARMLVRDKPLLVCVIAWTLFNVVVIYSSSLRFIWGRLW